MIELFINPDEGAWGMNIKRNHQKTKWENLSTHEKKQNNQLPQLLGNSTQKR